MAEMNRLARWMVNVRTEGRGRRALARLGRELRIPSAARVLELGCGGGGLLALIRERFQPARLVGTDFDPAQVQSARAFLTIRWGDVPPTVELREADALRLPFPDASFDVVFAMMMLHHVESRPNQYVQRPRALQEVRRVLVPGGALVYSEIFRRQEIRRTLAELGFHTVFLRSSWRADLSIVRASAPG
ncbi:MAG TPA: class I SAM-dependent methyltransferase [Thermoplasmata archaeon]|nr:class I SAM-dependent methyltransferase [Thermoplasmata archaeon]